MQVELVGVAVTAAALFFCFGGVFLSKVVIHYGRKLEHMNVFIDGRRADVIYLSIDFHVLSPDPELTIDYLVKREDGRPFVKVLKTSDFEVVYDLPEGFEL